ncbi:Hypothetical protein Cul210932_0822 [Corynebacterium ulcerans]|nr:Hypothetical protein Cul210932_0822 [Corynebacterium ulcerans]
MTHFNAGMSQRGGKPTVASPHIWSDHRGFKKTYLVTLE